MRIAILEDDPDQLALLKRWIGEDGHDVHAWLSGREAMKQAGVKLDYVLEIDVPFDAIIERMSGRRSHPGSGRTYHVKFNPPKVPGKDDVTGEPLVQRDDDKEETVKKRLAVYHQQTEPLVNYYAGWAASGDEHAPQLHRIDGLGTVDEVRDPERISA